MRNITSFERSLYLATENTLEDITEIVVRDEYSTVTYTREDLEAIGEIIAEEQYMDWLMSQGEDAYNAEIERERQEKDDWEAYAEAQCELARKAKEDGYNDAA